MVQRTIKMTDDDGIVLENGASITGAVYCGEKMTLDGTVVGTVITNDFYFYQSPTRYYGWLRSGTIDRRALPKGYMMPIGLSSDKQLAVIDWL